MLEAYALENGYHVEKIYVDDGYTGTNFDRPDFKRMIEDIKQDKINMVLTKDLSRLGRNYVLTGQYTDFFFPENDVRFIAVNDGYDTNKEDNDIAPFKNILNEMYAKDISKKVKSSRRVAAKEGKFMGSIPPYGYIRSKEDKHKLEIDPITGDVVRRIFELYCSKESARYIADIFNNEQLPNPQEYYFSSIGKENPYKKNSKTWSSQTILSILKNQVYIGHMVQSKRAVKSFKVNKVIALPPEFWQVVHNTHDAIISITVWNEAQEIMMTNSKLKPKKNGKNHENIFSNLLRCSDCHSKLVYSSDNRNTKNVYRCSRYTQHGSHACKSHRISYDTIYNVVFEDLKRNAILAKEDEEAFLINLRKATTKEQRQTLTQYANIEKELVKKLSDINAMIKKCFEKNCSGVLSDEIFNNLVSEYEREKQEVESQLSQTRKKLEKAGNLADNAAKEIETLKKYATIRDLNRNIVTSLIHSIEVSHCEVVDGEKVYDIKIKYRFESCFETRTKISIPQTKNGAASEGTAQDNFKMTASL